MAQQTVDNGDGGLVARTKWNDNFTETYRPFLKEIKIADFTVENNGSYLVDTTTGAIVATVPAGVDFFIIGDFADTWTAIKTVSVDIGADNFLFNDTSSQKDFEISKHGSVFRVYRSGTFIEERNI